MNNFIILAEENRALIGRYIDNYQYDIKYNNTNIKEFMEYMFDFYIYKKMLKKYPYLKDIIYSLILKSKEMFYLQSRKNKFILPTFLENFINQEFPNLLNVEFKEIEYQEDEIEKKYKELIELKNINELFKYMDKYFKNEIFNSNYQQLMEFLKEELHYTNQEIKTDLEITYFKKDKKNIYKLNKNSIIEFLKYTNLITEPINLIITLKDTFRNKKYLLHVKDSFRFIDIIPEAEIQIKDGSEYFWISSGKDLIRIK